MSRFKVVTKSILIILCVAGFFIAIFECDMHASAGWFIATWLSVLILMKELRLDR